MTLKFSREDEQILALNYENLCDNDYLHKLFISDQNIAKDEHSADQGKSASEAHLSNAEFPEDVIIFGDNLTLGNSLFDRRLRRDLTSYLKFQDGLALQISRQSIIYEHMADLMLKRFNDPISLTDSIGPNLANSKSIEVSNNDMLRLVLDSLFSIFGDDEILTAANLRSILDILIKFFDPLHNHNHVFSERVNFDKIRYFVSKNIHSLHSLKILNLRVWDKTSFREEVKAVLYSIYCYVCMGLLSHEVSDLIVALDCLIKLHILVESRTEDILMRTKEALSTSISTTNISKAPTATPAALTVSSSKKQKQKVVTKEKPLTSLVNERVGNGDATESSLDDSKQDAEPSVSVLADGQSQQHTLKSVGSGSKLNALREKGPLPSKPTEVTTKTKPSKKLQENAKVGNDNDIAKDTVNSLTSLVVNHAVLEYDEPMISQQEKAHSNRVKSNIGGGGSASNTPQKPNSGAEVSSSIASSRKIEREIKESVHEAMRVPTSMIQLLSGYATAIGKTTTKSHPSSKANVAMQDNTATNKYSTKVWSCGQNSYGELGLGDINTRKSFAKVSGLDDKAVVSIGAGNEHSLFVTKGGKLYTSGYNDNGQCGVGTTQQVRQPTLVQSLEDEEIQQVFVFNGCEHTIVVTKEGKVFSFGYNYRGQLGLGNTNSESIPRPVRALMSRKVVLAACSYHHSLFLCSDGALFACGRNDSGQLGHGDTVDKKTPQAILSAPRHIVSLSCGQFHTAVSTTQGIVYACGKNDYGQLGLESTTTVKVLSKVNVPNELDHVTQVCCGYYHTLLLSGNGVIAGFGRNDYGQLGLGHAQPKVFQATLIHHLRDKAVTALAAGCYHSIAVTANGMLYVFGRNNHGQLGAGDLDERHTPHPVDDFVGQKIVGVSAGFYHTLVLVGNQSLPGNKPDVTGASVETTGQVESSDPKQLSTLLLKDLQLLGADIVENAGREVVVECPSYVSSSDLLTILMKNISCFLSDAAYDNVTCATPETVRTALLSLSSLMTTAWNILSGKQSISFFAISPEDMLGFMCKLLVITSRVMQRFSKTLKEFLAKHKDVDLGIMDSLGLDIPSELSQRLSALHKQEGDVPPLLEALQSLRGAYMSVYFELNSSENALRGEGDAFSSQICDLFAKEHSIFFNQPFLLLKFFVILRGNLQAGLDHFSPTSVSNIRLMSSLAKVFHANDVTKSLFDTSPCLGLEIVFELSCIYNSFSRKSVEKRLLSQSSGIMNVEVKKLVTTLEQALSSLLKLAVPYMLNYTGSDLRTKDLAKNIIVEMIDDACELLDLVAKRGLTEENLSLLRYGTLLPSVLPTVLLYAVGFVKKGKKIPDISNTLHLLISKLERVCKWEMANAHTKLVAEKKSEQTSSLSKKDLAEAEAAASIADNKDDELSESVMEEILYVKREHNQISWWFRLLKLSIVLLAKITVSSHEQCWSNYNVNEEFAEDVVMFLHHNVWEHLLVSDKDLQDRYVYDFVAKRMEESSSIGRVGLMQDLCVKFRELEKKRDPVYRMLNQPARAAVSGTIIQALENLLFESVSSLQLSWVKEDSTQERLFRKISKFSKLIFSKRSTLLANTDLSWTETLSNLEKVLEEVCSFVTSCHCSLRYLNPLPLPSSNKFSYRWRKVISLVICVNRWSKVTMKRPSHVRENALDFILQVTNYITQEMTVVPSIVESAHKLHYLYCGLAKTTIEFDAIASAISATARYYSQVSFLSLKSDLLSNLTNILHETRLYDGLQNCSVICMTTHMFKKLQSASLTMESLIRLRLEQWLHSPSAFAMIDLQVINHLIKLQETLQIATASLRGRVRSSISFTTCTSVITKLYEKYHLLANGQEEKSFISKRVSSYRERNAASKRALFSVLTYMHNVVLHDIEHMDVQAHRSLFSATENYNHLLFYLQSSRNDEAMASGDERLLGTMASATTVGGGSVSEKESTDVMSAIPFAATATVTATGTTTASSVTPATIATTIQSANLRQTKENAKKRCQDLIVKPMEFSKSCEGVVVAGEKLLNNCKGTDFSMATWILVTSVGTGTKSSFIFGKVSHNETWPMILLKNDGKLEVVFGHNNEFEKSVSEATIPLLTWTHIAVISEQKKVKLFINGVLDSQAATTKGNNRAILFPLVIGTCPSQVRTRISAVKEGFDGLVAQFKYYSRALSPIHVKIIYDNGPPELIDFSAKIIYYSLAALKCVYAKLDHAADSLVAAKRTMELCHMIFVTDTNRRNRYAALHVLRFLLSRFELQEFVLSGWKMRNGMVEKVSHVDIMQTTFLPRHLNLHQRLVLYFLRIIGLNWMQYYKPVDGRFLLGDIDDTDSMAIIEEIVTFTPRSCFSKSILDKLASDSRTSTPATSLNDRLIAQEEPRGETSYQIIAMLHALINGSDIWFTAAKVVIEDIFTLFQNKWSTSDTWKPTKLSMLDLMGATLLLGGGFSGSYLGAEVKNFFDDGIGTLVQINHTVNGATILSAAHSAHPKSMRLRLSDFEHEDEITLANDGRLIHVLLPFLLGVLDTLSPSMKLVGRDFLCNGVSSTSTFQQKSFLRCLRPVESFVFIRLLTTFVTFAPHVKLASDYPFLWELLNDTCYSSMEVDSDERQLQQIPPSHRNCSPSTFYWFQSMKYFSLLPEQMLLTSFPMDQDERLLIDFVNKQLGVQDDLKTIGRQISTGGLFTKAMLANMPQMLDTFDIAKFEMHYLVSDKSSVSRTYSMTFDSALSDADCSHAWTLMQMIRSAMIRLARNVVRQTIGIVGYTSGSYGAEEAATLWRIFTTQDTDPSKWIHIDTLNPILRSNIIQIALQDLVDDSVRTKITHFLASAVKFASMTMLFPAAYKAKENILLTTDFFGNLTKNMYLWLEYNVDANEFEYLVQVTLSELLPCIPYTENTDMKISLMQICVYFIRRFLSRMLHSSTKPNAVLLDIVRSNYFNIIRTYALEQVVKFKGHNLNNISHYAYNLTQLVSGLELIQRRATTTEHKALVKAISGATSSKMQATIAMAKMQATITAVPKLVVVRPTLIDLDLSPCVQSIWTPENTEVLKAYGEENLQYLRDNTIVEVALCVATSSSQATTDAPIFETIFCGSSQRLLQSGLVPDCLYHLKCRAYVGASIPLTWSPILEFRTEKGSLFSFDSLKCGADILLSEDGMTASYTGDDTWSTVLGNRSFTTGIVSWEMKINQSSTAYIFVGVATSAADLNSFLGGCSHGWGFIGEQALYHNREKVKVYGEAFTTGDVIGIKLDLHQGTISFTKNKRPLGVAFDKIYGDLYPAVAFYNAGQEISIVQNSFRTESAQESIPVSSTRLSMDEISLLNELILSMYSKAPLSHRLAVLVAEHCNQWCTTVFVRCRTIAKRDIFLATDSPLLKRFNLHVGERVRTYYGVAEVAGVAYNRVWFRVNPAGEVWFFTNYQIVEGKMTQKLFMRCSYSSPSSTTTTNNNHHSTNSNSATSSANNTTTLASTVAAAESSKNNDNMNTSTTTAATTNSSSSAMLSQVRSAENLYALTFDAATILDLLEPSKWSVELDAVLVAFLSKQSETLNIETWKLSSEHIFSQFRALQQAMGRVVIVNRELTQKWGISGPKRKAVIARLGLLRIFNQWLDMYLPFVISDNSNLDFEANRQTVVADDFVPQVETFSTTNMSHNQHQQYHSHSHNHHAHYRNNVPLHVLKKKSAHAPLFDRQEQYFWPSSMVFSWDKDSERIATAQELWLGPLNALRRSIFTPLKISHFLEILKKTATRPNKTEDDYDYPDNLPHVKINRLKAFRAREIADLLHLPGDDFMLSTMFCQLWRELRPHNAEKLRISYTHPMDDGQSRTFKIKFEGEGVDDYGGPYREIFQQICTELQLMKPLGEQSANVLEQVAAEAQMSMMQQQPSSREPSMLQQHHHVNNNNNNSELLSASGFFSHNNNNNNNYATNSAQQSIDGGLPPYATTNNNNTTNNNGSIVGDDAASLDHNNHMMNNSNFNARRCFLPLFIATPNWHYDKDCTEKYKFMFHPQATSPFKQELFYFLGQLVGIAIRSRITLDLSFPSYIWKCMVGERISEKDLASFDQSAYDLVLHLQVLYQHYQQDQEMLLQQVTSNNNNGHNDDNNNNHSHHAYDEKYDYEESVGFLSNSMASAATTVHTTATNNINNINSSMNISSNNNNHNNNNNAHNHNSSSSGGASISSKRVMVAAYDEAVNVSNLDDVQHHVPSAANTNTAANNANTQHANNANTAMDVSFITMVTDASRQPAEPISHQQQYQQHPHHLQQQQLQHLQQSSYVSQLSFETHGDDYGLDVLADLTWSVTRSDGVIVDLVPQGRHRCVEIQELGTYLQLLVTTRLQEITLPLHCFRKGLVSIIPESALSVFTWEELEMIVCGSQTIDISRLKANTEYDDDVPSDDPHIGYFWEILEEFDESEKSAFLKFVWARPSLPPPGVEFTQKMRILSATNDASSSASSSASGTAAAAASAANSHAQDNYLPKAHTCFFSINLPRYSSKKVMAEKLRYAILNCTEMDGDFRTTESEVPGWSTGVAAMDQLLAQQHATHTTTNVNTTNTANNTNTTNNTTTTTAVASGNNNNNH